MSKIPAGSELPAADLNRMLREASLFAGKDGSLPQLNVVRLEATGTRLLAVASDRFMVGVSSAPFESEPFQVSVPMDYVPMMRSMLNQKYRVAELRATPKGRLVHLIVGDTMLTVPTFNGDFVAWRKLFDLVEDDSQVSVVAVNPQYMAKFGKVGGHCRQMAMRFTSPAKPILVTIGQDFVGLIMPVRLPDVTPTMNLPEWLIGTPLKKKG